MSGDVSSFETSFTAIASIVGASAWLAPYCYKKFSKPIVKAKLISRFENAGSFNNKPCLMHFMALNIISLKKCFNLKETKISISYTGSADRYTGELFWARKNQWVDSEDNKLVLSILPEETLLFTGVLPEEKSVKLYLTFKVDKAELVEFEDISITFIEQSGHECSVVIKSSDLNPNQILWDDRVWKKLNT
ncbi:hypothetical protein J7X09_004592 [Vibrio parahaemolyticus]|nr:hypothetical protein [Vibrio parahaemolyticus]